MNKLLFLFLIIVFTSCDKELLEPVPETSISGGNAFETPERILAQVNGLYAAVKNPQFLGGRYTIYQELRADDFIMNKPNAQTGQLTWGHTVNSSTAEVENLWSSGYAAINRIHIFLEGLETAKEKISDSLYQNYRAEAFFLRGLAYFLLVQQYARPYVEDNGAGPGLPLRLGAEKSSQNNDLARSSVAAVYAQVLSDLDAAEAGLPLKYATASLNATRAHKNAAIALKTRVYLAQGAYEQVKTEAAKIVSTAAPFSAASGVAHKLEANVTAVFSGSYTGPEAVFFLPMNAQDGPGGQNALSYYFTFNPGNAEYFLNTAGTVAKPAFSPSSNDARKNLVVTQQGELWLYKYKMPSPYTDYIPVIRYAEVLLNYAEAAARTGDVAKATALLYAIRNRADASYTFAHSGLETKEALVSTILEERRIELLGEGFRVPDLLRTLQPLPGKIGNAGTSPAVQPSESRYIWPIPANELSTNTLMVPNP
ncbi:RagB/SusD family nutrient uptake outer membrane protein [Paracnuella aquatica]|uniref:RagB/SusD family nutrient uptake outer membrane protein n=1 Tax=Paracnuella aquatica TaxID=2268757 RepID=UPI0019D48620|nr:RagB/SusD family nutrient uptake outer membrane protein [Paracnuella aquatica]